MSCPDNQAKSACQSSGSTGLPARRRSRPSNQIFFSPIAAEAVFESNEIVRFNGKSTGQKRRYRVTILQTHPADETALSVLVAKDESTSRLYSNSQDWRNLSGPELDQLPRSVRKAAETLLERTRLKAERKAELRQAMSVVPMELHPLLEKAIGCADQDDFKRLVTEAIQPAYSDLKKEYDRLKKGGSISRARNYRYARNELLASVHTLFGIAGLGESILGNEVNIQLAAAAYRAIPAEEDDSLPTLKELAGRIVDELPEDIRGLLFPADRDSFEAAAKQWAEYRVRQALDAGETVPPEIMIRYPGLVAEFGIG